MNRTVVEPKIRMSAGDCQVDSQVMGDNTELLLLRSRHSGHWSH